MTKVAKPIFKITISKTPHGEFRTLEVVEEDLFEKVDGEISAMLKAYELQYPNTEIPEEDIVIYKVVLTVTTTETTIEVIVDDDDNVDLLPPYEQENLKVVRKELKGKQVIKHAKEIDYV